MGSRPLQKYAGSCHCGAVRFEIETDFPQLSVCDCSICRRKNALMVKLRASKFNVFCLHDFEPTGIPVRHADGAAMP